MIGVAYKDTFAAKGSALYAAITEDRPAEAKRIYAETSARHYALLAGLSVPRLVFELDKDGNQNGKWSIQAPDAQYDNNGRIKK